MADTNDPGEPELRWIETPRGRAVINGVALVVLLAATQHFGFIEPGPPVTLDNISVYAIYGMAVGAIMYFWTRSRLGRQARRREEERLRQARAAAYETEDSEREEKDR